MWEMNWCLQVMAACCDEKNAPKGVFYRDQSPCLERAICSISDSLIVLT